MEDEVKEEVVEEKDDKEISIHSLTNKQKASILIPIGMLLNIPNENIDFAYKVVHRNTGKMRVTLQLVGVKERAVEEE